MKVVDSDLAGVRLTVNGQAVEASVSPASTLQSCLHHKLGFREVRHGCGEGVCGACTVLVDGEPRASCLMLALQAEGRSIVTADGLENHEASDGEHAALLREFFVERQAFQCGYCSSGILVSAAHHIASEEQKTIEGLRNALSGHLCRCTGYQQIVEAANAAATGEAVSAAAVLRPDLREKMSGAARYPTDRQVENPLIGRILWSEYPSAKITAIDTSDAKAVPGVVAVLTHEDIPGRNLTGAVVFRKDQPLLASDQVRTMADAVALVAARDEESAHEALRRIRVSYEQLPPVIDMHESIKEDAPKIGAKGNIIAQFVELHGDVDEAFRTADVIIEDDYATTLNDHATMELEGGTGWLEGETLMLTVPHQTPDTGQRGVATMLGIPPDKVRIIAPRIGGSFGKYAAATVEGYLGLLIYKTGQPVRLVLDREEMLHRRSKRHPSAGRYRLGLRRDGTFVALEAEVLTDAGAYVWLTPAVAAVIPAEATGAYNIPNVRARARGVLTNNLITAPMRGYGSQQISFGIESLVEKAAHEIGMEPAELRRRNFKKVRTDGEGQPIPNSPLFLDQTLNRVDERLGKRPAPPDGWLHGRGLATVHAKYGYPYGMVDRFAVKVSVDSEGRFAVESDISDSGTAVPTEMTRLAAQDLGLAELPQYVNNRAAIDDPSGIEFSSGRQASRFRAGLFRVIEYGQTNAASVLLNFTARMETQALANLTRRISRPVNFFTAAANRFKNHLFPYNRDSFQPRFGSSRALSLCSLAVLDATSRLKKQALDVAARHLDVPLEEMIVDHEGVRRTTDNTLAFSWAQLAQDCGGTLSAMGEAHNPNGSLFDPATGNQRGPIDYMDASHGCDLAVNPETGEVKILKYVACHDVGYALNPVALRGQIIGGTAMGIGQALLERLDVREGKITNTGLHDYHVPTALEMPLDVEVELLESQSGMGFKGIKGIGESAAVVAPIAVVNALYDATGVQVKRIPSLPDEIVEMAAQRGSGRHK